MRTLKCVLLVLVLAVTCLALGACDDDNFVDPVHVHIFSPAIQPDIVVGTPVRYNAMGEPIEISPVDCGVRGDEYTGRACILCYLTIYTLTGRNVEQPHEPENFWYTLDQPSCVKAGTEYRPCIRCGAILETRSVPAHGHEGSHVKSVAATCTQSGRTMGKKCKYCGEILSGCKTIPALGHDVVLKGAVDATCTQPGKKADRFCKRSCCECYLSAGETIPALGHDPQDVPAVAATCTQSGSAAGTKCARCGDTLSGCEIVPALGHDWGEWTVTTAPTCTEKGEDARACKREGCGATETREVDVLGHDWGEWTVTTAPTCTEKGVETHTCKREGCGATETREVDVIDHTPVTDAAVEPTCTQSGKSEGSHCSVCGAVLVPQYGILALGHQVVVDPRKEPTCTQTGLTEGTHCSVCGEVLVAQEVIPATGEHDLVDHAGQAATCTAVGWNAYQTCSRCDYTTHAELPALGHDLVHHDAQAPTCTAVGWDAYDTCSRCDYTTYEEKAALGHTGGTATCMAKAKCAVCGEEYGTLGEHDWDTSAWITDGSKHWHKCKTPSCTAITDEATHSGGTATCKAKARCAVCGEEYGALGQHDWDTSAWITDGSKHWHKCKTPGCTAITDEAAHSGGTATCQAKARCAACGEEYGALGVHDWDTSAWITDGSKHWHKCKTPGCTATTDEAAHSGGTATCQAKARCAVCGEEYGTLADHDWDTSAWITDGSKHWHKCKAPGCTATTDEAAHSGGTATCQTKARCAACGEEYGALGVHDWDTSAWITDGSKHWHKCKTPGCTATTDEATHSGGTATCQAKARCAVCGEEYGALGQHQYVDRPDGEGWDRVETVDGKQYVVWGHYKVCSICETARVEVQDGKQEMIEDDSSGNSGGSGSDPVQPSEGGE